MLLIVKSIFLLAGLLWFYTILGNFILYKANAGIIKKLVVGFFTYYSLFQLIALPMIILNCKLSLLSEVWMLLMLVLFVFLSIFWFQRKQETIKSLFKRVTDMKWWDWLFFAAAFLLFLWICRFNVFSADVGIDVAHYMGSVANAVQTDRMYAYDGYSGVKLSHLNFHFALSSFYMHSAVFCQFFRIPALIFQRYCISLLGVIIAFAVIYLTSTCFLRGRTERILTLFFAELLFFVSFTSYMGPRFMLFRGVEAKAFCAMVVCPGVVWALIEVFKENKVSNWKLVFIISMASVPISMSAIYSIPLVVMSVTLAIAVYERKFKTLIYGGLCCLPNFCYCIFYLLVTKGIVVIAVK